MVGSSSNIRVTCWNSRGYLASIPYMRHLLSECEILAISEHWVHENRLRCLSGVSNTHSCFARASRLSSAEDYGNGRGQGGIAIFWDSTLKGVSVVSDIILDRACAIRLQTRDGGIIYFISVYLPADGSCESLESSLDDITEIIESRDAGAHMIVLGDFNGDIGSNGGNRGTRLATRRGEMVSHFFDRHGLTPLNMREGTLGPIDTYMGNVNGSTLDYIAVSPIVASLTDKCFVHEWHELNTSDHSPVSATFSLCGIGMEPRKVDMAGHIKWDKLTQGDKFSKYQRVLEPHILKLKTVFVGSVVNHTTIDDAFSNLTDSIREVSDKLPHTRFKKNLKPYWNSALSALKYRKVMSYKKWVADGRPRGPNNPLFRTYKNDKKAFHAAIKKISKEYEDKEVLDAVKSAEFNRNSFWRLIRTARKNQIDGVNAVRRPDKTVVHDLDEVLQVWANHFATIGTPKKANHYDDAHFRSVSERVARYNEMDDDDLFLNTPFTVDEVIKAIRTLHLGKAPGFDYIMTEHLVYAGPAMADFLCILYNAILNTEYIPTCFRRGVQVPLYKGKDSCVLDPNNYRGITLLPTYNKLFEILIWQRLKPWWYENKVISDLQGACKFFMYSYRI